MQNSFQTEQEQKLATAWERLQLVARSANIGFWDMDLITWRTYFSPEWKKQLGYANDEEGPRNHAEVMAHLHPEDRGLALTRLHAYINSPVGDYENEFRLLHRNGSYRWILSRGTLIDNGKGHVTRMVGCHIDITALRNALEAQRKSEREIRELNATLEQRVLARTALLQEANRELDAFNYSVSHDLRTPLRSIEGFSQALLEDNSHQLDEAGQDYLKRIFAATQRMNKLIDTLLNLSHLSRRVMQVAPLNLSVMAHAALEELRSQTTERQVKCIIADQLVAEGDADLLQIVLDNLLGNAWKYTSKCDQALIEFGICPPQQMEYTQQIESDKQTGRNAEHPIYFVRDNGAGFDMQHANRLFKLFQRLHRDEDFPGNGVGLATVYRIIGRHGGRIWLESTKGAGTTAFFTLWENAAVRCEFDRKDSDIRRAFS